jgi:hypothetical protein
MPLDHAPVFSYLITYVDIEFKKCYKVAAVMVFSPVTTNDFLSMKSTRDKVSGLDEKPEVI